MPAPTILAKDSRQCLARWNNVIFQIRRGELTLEGLGDVERHVRALGLRFPGPKGVLGIMESGAPIPSQEVRAAQLALYRTVLTGEAGWFGVVVIPPEGVTASLKRTVVASSNTQLNASAGPGHMKTAATVAEGASWLVQRVATGPVKFDAAALEEAWTAVHSSYLAG